ncbi:hypothetical protein [Actinoplanes regularis]|uniref:Uncharacterized protein n=1 Tax=Actinoplanes regularis TaxID=52697 RepID=A0A238WRU1_9ACTN|nr:hypothetical protein [Actinoplanes regularis]GIE84579.1 hypothetical protein Are01nite_10590 [Actinoplanes regularis]SNR49101.1 hypothetical protein SAMN06264365_102833 [Actinoplanes regularis]
MTEKTLPGRPPQWAFALLAEVQALRSEVASLRGMVKLPEAAATDDRAGRIADIRALADLLEANPGLPMPWRTEAYEHIAVYDDPSATSRVATVRRVADILGVTVDDSLDDRTECSVSLGRAQ